MDFILIKLLIEIKNKFTMINSHAFQSRLFFPMMLKMITVTTVWHIFGTYFTSNNPPCVS